MADAEWIAARNASEADGPILANVANSFLPEPDCFLVRKVGREPSLGLSSPGPAFSSLAIGRDYGISTASMTWMTPFD